MISVIMLTYNRETLVPRAIESILSQTYRDFELLIVDNGSTDKSGEIADTYAAGDPRIRVIHRERGSIGAGRNTGLDAARGEYLTFVDDDDWVEPDFLAFLLELLEAGGADISICGTEGRVFDEKQSMDAREALVQLMWRKRCTAGFPMKLFRRELARDLRFSETDRYDDIGLIYRLFARAGAVAYHGLPKYHVLRHSGNNSAWTTDHRLLTPETLEEYLTAYRVRTEWLSGLFPDRAAAWRYFEWSFMISMVEKIARLELTDCDAIRERLEAALRADREEFLACPEILDFEREWVERYIPAPPAGGRGAEAGNREPGRARDFVRRGDL